MMVFCKHRVLDKCKKDGRPCFFSEDCFEPEEEKKRTNADRIRDMSDEELVDKLYALYLITVNLDCEEIAKKWCDGKAWCIDEHGTIECDEDKHKACILRWLQQPAE